MHLGADEILAIADDARNDWRDVEIESGRKLCQFDHEHAKWSDSKFAHTHARGLE
jgi:hypothetical protein